MRGQYPGRYVVPGVHLIERDDAVRDGFLVLCETAGFSGRGYESAEEFLAATAEDGCIISALDLPGMNGLDLFLALKKRGNALPFALLLNAHKSVSQGELARAGVEHVLRKPLTDRTLLAFMERFGTGNGTPRRL